jgi:hypothetical protein
VGAVYPERSRRAPLGYKGAPLRRPGKNRLERRRGLGHLSRIAGANCGSVYSQAFTYDAFGNLNKSGSTPPGVVGQVKAALCRLALQGQALSAGGTGGVIHSSTGSINLVTDYNTGLSNIFVTQSTETGFNPALSGSISAGYIYSVDSTFSPSDYSRHFSTGSFSAPSGPGSFFSAVGSTMVGGLSWSASAIPFAPSAGIQQTNTSRPLLGPEGSLLLSGPVDSYAPSTLSNTIATMWCSVQ